MRSSELRKLKLFEMRIKTWNFRTTTYGVRSIAFLTSVSAHCAVVYTLEYHEVTNSSTEVYTKYSPQEQTNLTIPNFDDSCQAYTCFSQKNMTCPTKNTLWTIEQGFSCKKTYYNHFGNHFYPFFNEFCLLMACVFYEMFSTADPGEEEDVNVPEGTPNEDNQDNAPAVQEGNSLSVQKAEIRNSTARSSPGRDQDFLHQSDVAEFRHRHWPSYRC